VLTCFLTGPHAEDPRCGVQRASYAASEPGISPCRPRPVPLCWRIAPETGALASECPQSLLTSAGRLLTRSIADGVPRSGTLRGKQLANGTSGTWRCKNPVIVVCSFCKVAHACNLRFSPTSTEPIGGRVSRSTTRQSGQEWTHSRAVHACTASPDRPKVTRLVPTLNSSGVSDQ
jgi:hypothetical protein